MDMFCHLSRSDLIMVVTSPVSELPRPLRATSNAGRRKREF